MRHLTRAIALVLPLMTVACGRASRADADSSSVAATTTPAAAVRVTSTPYGTLPDGRAVELYTLTNAHGIEVRAMTYGAIITVIRTPDKTGQLGDIVLGFDSVAGYVKDSPYFGAVIGRYANRIARGKFSLDGTSYSLAVNNGPNALHGGLKGFDKVIWAAESFQTDGGSGVRFRYVSPDGEEGYPGELTATVTYTLTSTDQLIVDYEATTTKATPVNFSQHTYWNLHGNGSGTVLDHLLTFAASSYTPVDATLIPTGAVVSVAGTPFDFRQPTAIGARIDAPDAQLTAGRGYDHNMVLDKSAPDALTHAVRVVDPVSGRTLDISTTEPGVQYYTGNFLDGTLKGKGGQTYAHRSGLVLETQHFPDSPNQKGFPSTILRPGETFRSRTVFGFGVVR